MNQVIEKQRAVQIAGRSTAGTCFAVGRQPSGAVRLFADDAEFLRTQPVGVVEFARTGDPNVLLGTKRNGLPVCSVSALKTQQLGAAGQRSKEMFAGSV